MTRGISLQKYSNVLERKEKNTEYLYKQTMMKTLKRVRIGKPIEVVELISLSLKLGAAQYKFVNDI